MANRVLKATDLTIDGNLVVTGTTASVESTNSTLKDNIIVLNQGETGAGVTLVNAGLEIDRDTEDNAQLVWDEVTDKWQLTVGTTVTDTLTGSWTGLSDTPGTFTADKFVKVNAGGTALEFVDEADPVFLASPAGTITTSKIANWDEAYGWGNHALAGYLTGVGGLTSHTDVDAVAGAGDDGKILYYDHASTSFKWKTDATGGGGGDIFKTLAVAGQSDVVADSATDTLTLVAGSNMTITTNATTDTITFAAAGGGGGGSSSYTFTVNYAVGGTSIQSITNLPAGWSSSINGSNVTITHTASGQPMGISFYGLDKSASPDTWKYGYPTSTYPVTFPDTGAGEVISTTEFTLNVGTSATGANTGTPFATSLAHIKVVF